MDFALNRYDMTDINASAAKVIALDPKRTEHGRRALAKRHAAAKLTCKPGRGLHSRLLDSGAWCLGKPTAGTLLPPHHKPADVGIVNGLMKHVVDKGESINDFGAGVGQYHTALSAALAEKGAAGQTLHWTGYDGAGNVVAATGGLLHYFDLTMPLFLPAADWVMSFEVGEHIPEHKEKMVFRNLHAHNCVGVVLSWGKLDQIGHGHINNHSPEYIAHRMHSLGYYKDEAMTKSLHEHNSYAWFRHPDNPAAWRRHTPRTGAGCQKRT